MPSGEQVGDLPVVVALGSVDPALVSGVLDGHCRFVAAPGAAELATAAGAIARADARVDRALLSQAPALRVIARTGVGTSNGNRMSENQISRPGRSVRSTSHARPKAMTNTSATVPTTKTNVSGRMRV